MTQPIKYTNIRPEQIMVGGSRYLKSNVIFYGEKNIMTFDIYNRQKYKPTGNEKFMLISKGVEYRPDLVSYDVYGFPDNWWKILETNNMKDVWEFKANITIMLPDFTI